MKTVPILFYTDDDADDLMIFEVAATAAGAETCLFEDGDLLLRNLNDLPLPDIVFVDLNMPKKSGYEIISEMKSSDRLKGIPIVILSTASDAQNIQKCKKVGANYYITKPTSMDQLKSAIAHAMKIDWNTFRPSEKEFVHSN